jgi:hypothetical protein
MTHAEALDGKFLPDLDEEQRKRFTPTELIIYKHAQDYRYIGLYRSISWYKRVYTLYIQHIFPYAWIYTYILCYTFHVTGGKTGSSRRPLKGTVPLAIVDELHQWYVLCCHMYILSYTCICQYILSYL